MEPLTAVAARHKADYGKSRLAAIRGEFTAELRGTRWYVDPESYREWVERHATERVTVSPVPAA